MKQRSSDDALERVLGHCRMVRDELELYKRKIHQRAAGLEQPELVGGIILSLDLTKAFDVVSRDKLFQAMRRIGIHEHKIAFLKLIYTQTYFEFSHRGETRRVRTFRGIRQGCKAAPCLWAFFIADILLTLSDSTCFQWVSHHNTVFADDWCTHDMFHNMDELTSCVHRLGLLFDTLTAMGMTVNDKTVALMKMTGKMVRQAQSRHTTRTCQGVFLRIPRSDGSFTHVRLVARHTYLGAVVSYGQFESLTLAFRLKSATKSAMLLHVWLRGKGGLNRKQKATVWVQCIFTSAVHSLLSVGMTSNGLLQLDRFCLLQLRKIFEQPVHLDHVTHKQFLQSHHLKDPLSLLRRRCSRMMKRNQLRKSKASPDDLFANWDCTHIATQLNLIEHFNHQRRSSYNVPSQPSTFKCDHCSKAFPSLAELRRHCTREHDRQSGLLRSFDFQRDVHNGVPTYRRCKQHFTSWKQLKKHVMFVCTAPLPQEDDERRKFHEQQSNFLRWADADLAHMDPDNQLCASFCVRCAVCNKFCNCLRSMKYHHLVDHPTAHAAHTEILQDLTHRADTASIKNCPCKFCCVDVKKRHDCIILRQLAMLIAHTQTTDEPVPIPYTTAADQPMFTCEVCQKQYLTKHGLELHKLSHQKSDSGDDNFDLCRDALPGNQCAHCHRKFPAMPALERHIRTGACNCFDKSKARTTMLDTDAELRNLYNPTDISNILTNQAVRKQLTNTCILCNNHYGRVHSLQKHLNTNHPQQWKKAVQSAEDLFQKHTSSLIKCFCEPTVNKAKKNRHRCVIFKQLAMLHTMLKPSTRPDPSSRQQQLIAPHQDNSCTPMTLVAPLAENLHPLPSFTDTDAAHHVDTEGDTGTLEQVLETTTDQALADLLATHVGCTEASTSTTHQDPPLELTDELHNELHLAFVDHAPSAIYHILAGDLHVLLMDPKVHNFLNRFCTMCNCAFDDFQDAEAHFKQHWCSFGFPIEEFDPSLQLFLHGLSAHSWFRSSDTELCLFLQCFVLRFLAAHFSDDVRRQSFRTAAHLATCHERGRLGAPQESPRRPCGDDTPEQEDERKRKRSRSRSAATDSEADISRPTTRRSDQSTNGGTRVHSSPGIRPRQHHGEDDAAKSEVAPRYEQKPTAETGTCVSTHGDSTTTSNSAGRVSPLEPMLQRGCERGNSDGQGNSSIPELVPQDTYADSHEAATHEHAGRPETAGGNSQGFSDERHSPGIPLSEKNFGRRTSATDSHSSLDVGCGIEDSPEHMASPADTVLSQHLATDCMPHETSHSEALRPGRSDITVQSKKLIRICLNINGVSC